MSIDNGIFFLILHYGSFCVTSNCIESINKLEGGDTAGIVVVDNASNNGTAEKIQLTYGKRQLFNLISIKEGKGFSYGNNIGYKYILEHYKAKLVIVCNNDIEFRQKDFISILINEYNQNKFFVAGPDVVNFNDGIHQNPLYEKPSDLATVDKRIKSLKKELNHIYIYKTIANVREFLRKGRFYKFVRKYKYNNIQDRYCENVCLFGACLIVSELFLEKERKLFTPETHFYCEEEILSYKCIYNGWKIIYLPSLQVIHCESKATRDKYKNYKKRREFMLENTINSLRIYKKYIVNFNK